MYLFKLLSVYTLFVYSGYVGHVLIRLQRSETLKERPLCSQQKKLRDTFRAELGVKEQYGKNDGQRIEEYLHYVGQEKGSPWCAAFVCWCLGKATIDNPKTAWSPALFPKGKVIYSKSYGKPPPKVQSGDVFGLWFPEKGRIAHVGFITSSTGKWVETVEGNTNLAGSPEGDGVYAKRRLFSTLNKVARYTGSCE